MKRVASVLVVSTLLVTSCEFKRLDTAKMQQEIQNQKIKHVTSAQVSTLATEQGDAIGRVIDRQPIRALSTKALVDSLAQAYGARIEFVPVAQWNQPRFDAKTKEVFAAYRYNAEKQLPQENNIQKIGDGSEWLYTIPVVMTPELTTAINRKQLPTLQPQKEKELLGLWAVHLSRKEIVRRIDPKTLEKGKL
ncbi:hypothetical protein [Siphonobacter curvatus]|uniref:Lipoprotein n=1 Tax=Siphonobacter curvatus TaxID=2094562 RepID=A0A2S7IFD5_9BACT|nr:hypothetical protein [Siphonobacter curvatus]PQA53735.1 hypothetical protein C5O19_23970 [Siphonobacter curvatus]